MKRELYYMPRGLSEMLDRTFASIARQSRAERNLARHTLFWLALGVGQLSPTAICEAFAVEQEDSVLNEDKIPAPQMLYRVCLGLISIDNDTGAISLLHNSIRDHIRENDKSLYRDGEEKKNDGEREIARICIQYLLLQDFSRFYDTNGDYIVPQLEKLSLLNYAACHWDEHARRTNDSDVTKLCLALLDDRKRLSTCLQIRYNDTNLMELEEILPFHLAARFGLLEVIQILIANNYGIVNQPDDRGSMPLHEAAKAGRTEVVKVLLACNASQTVYDADSKSPLYWSVRNGHDEVFGILQNEIAQIRGLDSVLEAAAENGNMLVIESLLESSLAVVQDSLLKALLAAVRHSHEYATKILLYHFPRHRHRASELADALCEAVQSGNESIADIILSWGADPNSQDNAGHSPVHYAAKEGHAALMEQLLHAGADVNIVDTSDGTTPLLQAVRRRDVALVVRLIHFGANVQARIESSGSTVFHEAVLTGNVDIIDQLVDAGADFMAYDLSHTQPWELAHGPFLEELHKRHLIPPGRIPFLHEQNLSHASTINDPGGIDYLTVGHGSMDVSPDYETAELDGRDDRLIGPEQGVVNLDMQEIVS
jgi:ankyrin repeat protein